MFNVNCVAKLRISEQNAKRKTKYFLYLIEVWQLNSTARGWKNTFQPRVCI